MHSKREITRQQRRFMNLPLHILLRSTNIHDLVVEKLRKKIDREPLKIAINNTIKKYHKQMQTYDEWDDKLLDKLEFIAGSKVKFKDAEIWSLSNRNQTRIFNAASDHQKRFLCLPLHVFKEQTNICSLVHKEAYRLGYTVDDFVNHIHKTLPNIDKWGPELCDLKFINDSDADLNTIEIDDCDPTPANHVPISSTSSSNTSPSTRVLRKRKAKEDTYDPVQPKRYRTRSATIEVPNQKNMKNMAYKQSKKQADIPMPDSKRTFQIVSFAKTDIQRKVEHFSLVDFVTKTNIKEIVDKEYRQRVGNKNSHISVEEMNDRIQWFFKHRENKRNWHETILKDLKLVEWDSDPTDFQKEVMQMDFETFVRTTNVTDLVKTYLQEKRNEPLELSENDIKDGLNHFDRLRKQLDEWQRYPLNQLVFNICKCKRYIKFEDKGIQTDPIESRDYGSQYQSVDLNSNDIDTSNDNQRSHHTTSKTAAKMALLKTHNICDSEIIFVQHISSQTSNEIEDNNSQDISMAEPNENDSDINSPIRTNQFGECDDPQHTESNNNVQDISSNENHNLTLQNQMKMETVAEKDDLLRNDDEEMENINAVISKLVDSLENDDDNLQSETAQSNLPTPDVEKVQLEISDRCELVVLVSHSATLTAEEPATTPTVQAQIGESANVPNDDSMIEFNPQTHSTELHVNDENVTHASLLDHSYYSRNVDGCEGPQIKIEPNEQSEKNSSADFGNDKENIRTNTQPSARIQQRRSSIENKQDVLRTFANAIRATYYLEQLRRSN